jgi:hypothetical protein
MSRPRVSHQEHNWGYIRDLGSLGAGRSHPPVFVPKRVIFTAKTISHAKLLLKDRVEPVLSPTSTTVRPRSNCRHSHHSSGQGCKPTGYRAPCFIVRAACRGGVEGEHCAGWEQSGCAAVIPVAGTGRESCRYLTHRLIPPASCLQSAGGGSESHLCCCFSARPRV